MKPSWTHTSLLRLQLAPQASGGLITHHSLQTGLLQELLLLFRDALHNKIVSGEYLARYPLV